MLATVNSAAVLGIDAYIVTVEVDVSNGLPQMNIVGLPDGAVRESKERVRAAIKNSGIPLSSRRVTVNLAPADRRKEGAAFDFPIALGLLACSDVISPDVLEKYLVAGELALDGSIKAVRGALPMTVACRDEGYRGILLPAANVMEAAVVEGIEVIPVRDLAQAVRFFNKIEAIEPIDNGIFQNRIDEISATVDMAEVKGQEHVKRAMEVAAAGGHNVIMIGPPGSGKTMLANRLATILPRLDFEEALQTTKVYSIAGMLGDGDGLIMSRPFRSPHHTISDVGLIGGGAFPKPGEISLAHNGLLFLDELPEFKKNVLEVLRQPLEDSRVTITRSMITISYPAKIMLVAAMNPCPCGFLGDPKHECTCTLGEIQRYRARISGPLMDRIDLHVEVPAVRYKELADTRKSENSETVRQRVEEARERQRTRFKGKYNGIQCNALMAPKHLQEFCRVDEEGSRLLEMVVDRLGMSARAYDRILKVARTIADLDDSDSIHPVHLSEAIQYRTLDRALR